MGQTVSNVGLKSDGVALVFYHHFGALNLDEETALTDGQVAGLIADAQVSQAVFDARAGALATWYAFPTLSPSQRAYARMKARQGCARWAGIKT